MNSKIKWNLYKATTELSVSQDMENKHDCVKIHMPRKMVFILKWDPCSCVYNEDFNDRSVGCRYKKCNWCITHPGYSNWFSCTKHRTYATAWWLWGRLVLARPSVSTYWWSPWLNAEHPIVRWGWTPRLSQPRRCLVDWMWPPMTGQMGSSLHCGEGHIRPRRYGTNAVRCSNFTFNFLQNPHNRHPIAHLWV